jgi:hypothetical protein
MSARHWTSIFALTVFAAPAPADTIHTTVGGKIEGTILDDESNDSRVVIVTKAGKQSYPRRLVENIELRADNRVETYKDALKRFGPSAEDQYQLGLWCQQRQYRKEATEHFRRAIAADPNHEGSREKLGYQRVGDGWKTIEEIKTSQGLVKNAQGRWVLPQQKEEAEQKAAWAKLRQEYFNRVRTLRRLAYGENAAKAEAALSQLKSIRDPAAIEALMKYLGDKKESSPTERVMLVEILTSIEDGESTGALVKIATEDESEEIRHAAVEALRPRKSAALTKTLAGILKNKDNRKLNAAAAALAELGDETVIAALVDVLSTKHTYTKYTTADEVFAPQFTGGGGQAAFTPVLRPDGTIVMIPNNLQLGQGGAVVKDSPPSQRVIEVTHKNEEVLNALLKLTEQDFGYDKKRWLAWLKTHSHEKAAKIIGKG